MLRRFHTILQRHHHADCLHREDGDAEELREALDRPYQWYRGQGRHIPDKVIERYTQSGSHEDVCHHRNRCQVLQVGYPTEQNQRYQQIGRDQPDAIFASVAVLIMFDDLFEVGGHNHRVHTAGAEVRDEQTDLNEMPVNGKERASSASAENNALDINRNIWKP